MAREFPFWLNGRPALGKIQEIRSPWDQSLLGHLRVPCAAQVEEALSGLADAFEQTRRWSGFQRYQVCQRVWEAITARSEEFAEVICLDTAKPIRAARAEVHRARTTFRLAAEEATRQSGLQLPVDMDERSQGYHTIVERFPIGPALLVTPFNFPLNLVAHKVAPALATGCPFILKPSEKAPLTSILLGEILAQAGLPDGYFSVLPLAGSQVEPLVADPRIRLVSFTGSSQVGWQLRGAAIGKPVLLELGGNSAVIVEPGTDLADAIPRIVSGAYGFSGQSCISVQRMFVHESIRETFETMFVQRLGKLSYGDPRLEETDVGPMIDEASARRIDTWVRHALAAGAKLICGGKRQGAFYEPTLLSNVPADLPLAAEEAFGPVAILESYREFSAALDQVNASKYGLQAGVFTRDIAKVRQAFERLEVGGVLINEVPTMRLESAPYGGVKHSGLGREGVRWAMEHFTEPKTLTVRYPG